MRETKTINITIGRRIQERRESAGMTQEQLAEQLGYSVNHISALERGKSGVTIEKLRQICSIFNTSADYMLFGNMKEGLAGPLISRVEELNAHHIKYLERIIDIYIESTKS